MKYHKGNKFNNVNFNLKHEIFSFFQAHKIIQFISISKSFKFSVQNLKCFRLIKENFNKFL